MSRPPDDPRTLAFLRERILPRNQDRSSSKEEFSVVGRDLPRSDAFAKVTGAAQYTADILPPRCLTMKLLRSRLPHARLRSVDIRAALALPGVHGILTGTDFDTLFGIIPWTRDELPLARERVRFIGDPLAAVAARDEETAEAALKSIRVEYEPLPALFSPEEAAAAGAPLLHDSFPGNLTKEVDWNFGEVDAAFAGAELVVGGRFRFSANTHAALEPHSAMAEFGADGRLTVWSSTQTPYYLHRELAQVLKIPAYRIRVIRPHVGGGFGGKSEPFAHEFCVALLAMRTGRPVRVVLSREEVFLTHRGRHAMEMDLRLAWLGEQGLALDYAATLDGGAYSSFGMVTTYYSGALNAGLYRMPHYRWRSRRLFTNKPAAGPKRGHGTVQPRFAIECLVDELAERLNRDPIAFREELFAGENVETVNGLQVGSSGFLECLRVVREASQWQEKFRRLPLGRGIGVAGSMYISGTNYPIHPDLAPQSGVQIKADRSGLITIFCGAAEIGQGSDTMLRQIVAEELGVDPGRCRVESQDSDICPVDLGSYSSRVTLMCGNAALSAARHLRRQIVAVLAEDWDVAAQRIMVAGDWAFDREDEAKRMPFEQALRRAEAVLGTLGSTGGYTTPNRGGHYRGALVGASPAYSFTAHVAELEVDLNSGRLIVHSIHAAHDCGRAINPAQVRGQIAGSVHMGLGEALFERFETEKGLLQTPNLLEYKLPTILDTPQITCHIVERPDAEGPYGAKEAGEGPLHPVLPAIACAVYDAIGLRLRDTPFSPAVVLKHLEAGLARKPAAPAGKLP